MSSGDWQTIAAIASAFLAGVGLLATALRWRELALRRGEVLEWANEAISTLETILLLCILEPRHLPKPQATARRIEAMFATATLIERGRMFFRNRLYGDFGLLKEPAYRGLRPAILDPLVLAHQVACHLADSDEVQRRKLKVVAEGALKRFVSLVQKEVGRSRTASADTARGGKGIDLDQILASLDDDAEGQDAASPWVMPQRPKSPPRVPS